jgi:serine/threonine protein kinase
MRKGDLIAGYVLTTDPQGGGGHSEWAFAQREGEEFFIKRFLQPTYPLPDGPGSQRTKEAKQVRCVEFERHQRLVMWKLGPLSGAGGNLVTTKEFFRERAFYYKVTDKVDVSRIGPMDIAAFPRDDRILIMLTAAKSLDTMHKAGLVHGDVKPDNLLIKALDRGGYAIKVIDFDNCFPVHHPPAPDVLVGDPTYYSPELLLYNLGEVAGDQLDGKNDVFALGLVFWRYLTGARPPLPAGATYPAEAIQAGNALVMPKVVEDRPLVSLVNSMLAKAAGERPSMSEVHNQLKLARRLAPGDRPSRLRAREPTEYELGPESAKYEPRLRGLGGGLWARLAEHAGFTAVPGETAKPAEPAAAEPSAEDHAAVRPETSESGKLKGKLLQKKFVREAEKNDESNEDLPYSLSRRNNNSRWVRLFWGDAV